MKYSDLDNDSVPLNYRVKHLEREAGFVRDYVIYNGVYRVVCLILSVSALVISAIALFK